MKNIINNPETSEAKHDPSLVKKIIEDILSTSVESRSNRLQIKALDESFIIEDGKELISTEITKNNPVKIIVYSENDPQRFDPKDRSKFSRPYKPAIYLD
jgi:leucyl-tRNA synthetase